MHQRSRHGTHVSGYKGMCPIQTQCLLKLLHLLGRLLLTILPDWKIKAVVLGSRMRMMTAAKRCRSKMHM